MAKFRNSLNCYLLASSKTVWLCVIQKKVYYVSSVILDLAGTEETMQALSESHLRQAIGAAAVQETAHLGQGTQQSPQQDQDQAKGSKG